MTARVIAVEHRPPTRDDLLEEREQWTADAVQAVEDAREAARAEREGEDAGVLSARDHLVIAGVWASLAQGAAAAALCADE